MSDEVLKVIERWQSDECLTSLYEAQVNQTIILPILRGLGWNPDDPYEVWPEYPVKTEYATNNRQVDYALLIGDTPKIFIEAKKRSRPLERYDGQLQDYARKRDGVEIAILTNGVTWWFYPLLQEGSWEERKFATVELDKQDKRAIVQELENLLGKENVISGKAVQNAEGLSATLPEIEIYHSDLSDVPAYFKDIAKKYGFKVRRTQPTRIVAIDQGGDDIFHIKTDLRELRLNDSKAADFTEFELIPPRAPNAKYAVLKADDPRAREALQKHLDSFKYKKVK